MSWFCILSIKFNISYSIDGQFRFSCINKVICKQWESLTFSSLWSFIFFFSDFQKIKEEYRVGDPCLVLMFEGMLFIVFLPLRICVCCVFIMRCPFAYIEVGPICANFWSFFLLIINGYWILSFFLHLLRLSRAIF